MHMIFKSLGGWVILDDVTHWPIYFLPGHCPSFLSDVRSWLTVALSPMLLLPNSWWLTLHTDDHSDTLLSQFLELLYTLRVWPPPCISCSLSCHTADFVIYNYNLPLTSISNIPLSDHLIFPVSSSTPKCNNSPTPQGFTISWSFNQCSLSLPPTVSLTYLLLFDIYLFFTQYKCCN